MCSGNLACKLSCVVLSTLGTGTAKLKQTAEEFALRAQFCSTAHMDALCASCECFLLFKITQQ